MLKYRLITAVILVPLLFWAIFGLPPVYFALLMAAFVGLSAWEWSRLVGFTSPVLRSIYVVVVFLGIFFVNWLPAMLFLSIAFLIWIWAAFAVWQFNQGRKPLGFQFPEIGVMLGFFILIACWLALITLRTAPDAMGPEWLITSLLINWATDTGAYFSGRTWGKHQLAPKVSPKKTWEGFIGGLVLALVVAVIASFFFPITTLQRVAFWGLAVIASLFSVVGDLTVSLLKRQSGVKDSGQILPGHGGILDRVDSIASGVVVFALGILFFGF